MAFIISIEDLFRRAFGLRRPIYTVKSTDTEPTSFDNQFSSELTTIQSLPADEPLKSSLGTAILSPLTFEGGQYKQRLKDDRIVVVQYPELTLPPTTLSEVTLKKITIKTPLVSGEGTFKEFITIDDYLIRIRGIFIGNTVEDVANFRRTLMTFWPIPKEIEIISDFLNSLGIEALVIDDMIPRQLEGSPLMFPFELSCTSDKPLQLNFGS